MKQAREINLPKNDNFTLTFYRLNITDRTINMLYELNYLYLTDAIGD
jgi:hypothetical protein